jgi:hypothetical protein
VRILLCLLCLPCVIRAEDLADLRRTARAQAADDLVGLASWCQSKKLYFSRDESYRLALEFNPDHAVARKKLRYQKRQGEWVQVRKPGPATDRNDAALPEFDERLRKVGGRYAETVIAQLERGWRSAPLATRAAVFAEIFRLDPDHARTRRAHGDVRRTDRWVLRETPRAAKRRVRLVEMARDALREVPPPRRSTLTQEEKAFKVLWKDVLQGSDWRLLIAAPPTEARRCLQVADASRLLLQDALGVQFGTVPGMRLLVMPTKAEYLSVLKNHPPTDEQTLKFDGALSGCWLKDSQTCSMFDNTADRRLEGCARQPVGFHLWGRFGLTGKQGWAWEGLGLYFTYQLTGHRLSYFTRKTRYANQAVAVRGLDAKMRDKETDWFKLAGELDPPDWKLLLAKDVNQLTNPELVWSYALAGFLLEAYPHKVAPVLEQLGKGRGSEEVLREKLGLPVELLATRVARFAKER